MTRSNTVVELGFVRLDGRRKQPLFRQLYDSIRDAILDGRLTANSRIPSSRDLVHQLGVSRTTVVTAIEQLIAEGYLQTLVGSGTFVSSEIPSDRPFVSQSNNGRSKQVQVEAPVSSYLSQRGRAFSESNFRGCMNDGPPKPFRPGIPALDQFPVEVWSQLVRRMWKELNPSDLSYGSSGGYFPLRESIASYLRSHRGVLCDADQVILTSGTQQAIDLVARICLDPGDEVLFENPGYSSALTCFQTQGATIAPMEVNAEGVRFTEAREKSPDAKLIYLTPSHQYPMGVTLPIEGRMEMIRWASDNNRLILEDDYDSEYRYGQKPIPAMQGLDTSGRTLYVGSLSKVAFPALGLGYLIVPKNLITFFQRAHTMATRPTSLVDQYVLHEFIREGHFARHLRRMRKTHAQRREVFVTEIEKHFSHAFTIIGSEAGLHCTLQLNDGRSDAALAEQLEKIGVISRPLSAYYCKGTPKRDRISGLVFGFACSTPGQIRHAIRKMTTVI